ncbi:TPA: hypothetical protein ACV4T7_007027 [Burkholderia ambifaria]
MVAEEIISRFENCAPSGCVNLLFFDRTDGETEGSYYIHGQKKDFENDTEFLVKSLRDLAVDIEWGEAPLIDLEIHPCERALRMPRYVKPGEFLCFPSLEILGFIPPVKIEITYFVEPKFTGVEECFLCETDDEYVLLYWYTTG